MFLWFVSHSCAEADARIQRKLRSARPGSSSIITWRVLVAVAAFLTTWLSRPEYRLLAFATPDGLNGLGPRQEVVHVGDDANGDAASVRDGTPIQAKKMPTAASPTTAAAGGGAGIPNPENQPRRSRHRQVTLAVDAFYQTILHWTANKHYDPRALIALDQSRGESSILQENATPGEAGENLKTNATSKSKSFASRFCCHTARQAREESDFLQNFFLRHELFRQQMHAQTMTAFQCTSSDEDQYYVGPRREFVRLPALYDFQRWIWKYNITKRNNYVLLTSDGSENTGAWMDPEFLLLLKESEGAVWTTSWVYDPDTGAGDLHERIGAVHPEASASTEAVQLHWKQVLKQKYVLAPAEQVEEHESLSPTPRPNLMLLMNTLEHLVDPIAALRRIHEVFSENDPSYLFAMVPTSTIPHGTPHHFGSITLTGLISMLLQADFEILEVGQWGSTEYVRGLLEFHDSRAFKDELKKAQDWNKKFPGMKKSPVATPCPWARSGWGGLPWSVMGTNQADSTPVSAWALARKRSSSSTAVHVQRYRSGVGDAAPPCT